VARTLGNLGYSLIQAGEYEKAEAVSRQALEIFEAHGDRASLELALAYANLGQAAYRLGRGYEAVRSNYAAGLALVEEYHPRSQWRVEILTGLARRASTRSTSGWWIIATRRCS
jgi:tetratricopeptide (TPR) repeat protein